ncbi:UNVERIFIED_CONTAM: hypothetical protein Sradi_7263400 [Sesamum radiatum]|uniref:Uncharacterized protein n=1 Tax=Sesamum radiatum TaxID=300843 RepID=A0AAW2IL61_SESRA
MPFLSTPKLLEGLTTAGKEIRADRPEEDSLPIPIDSPSSSSLTSFSCSGIGEKSSDISSLEEALLA